MDNLAGYRKAMDGEGATTVQTIVIGATAFLSVATGLLGSAFAGLHKRLAAHEQAVKADDALIRDAHAEHNRHLWEAIEKDRERQLAFEREVRVAMNKIPDRDELHRLFNDHERRVTASRDAYFRDKTINTT